MALADAITFDLDHVPIFPLPNTVLFPGVRLPLHVFEPRYRALTRDALDGDGVLAVALLAEGWEDDYYGQPDVHPVVGAGVIEKHEELDDGRYNILLRGCARLRITTEHPVGPAEDAYRSVRAEAVDDVFPDDDPSRLVTSAETLRQCCRTLLTSRPVDGAGALVSYISQINDPALLTNVISMLFIKDAVDQQALLETVSVATRLEHLTDHLSGMLIALETDPSDVPN